MWLTCCVNRKIKRKEDKLKKVKTAFLKFLRDNIRISADHTLDFINFD